MTLEEAQIHLEYVKAKNPAFLAENGITESIIADETLITEAAEIATQTHWGAADVSEEELFNRTLKRLIEERKLNG
jgi:hypothetical protein